MLGRGEHALHRALLDDLAVFHDAHLVGDLAHDPEVMRDEQHGHAEPGLNLLQQLEDLRLHRDVERGRGFVGDQKIGLVGERHGDHHALALSARELVRIARKPGFRIGDAHLIEQLEGARPRRRPGDPAMEQQNFADLLLDRVQRIERGHRLLEDDRDVVAAHPPHLRFGQSEQLPALEVDRAAGMARRRIGQELHDRQRGHRLARAGLADQGDGLALGEVERHPVDGENIPFALAEGDGEIAHGEEGGGQAITFKRSSISCMFGLTRFIPAGNFLKSLSLHTKNPQLLRIAVTRWIASGNFNVATVRR